MKKCIRIAAMALAIGSASIAAYAAECAEGPIIVSGSTCSVVGGHCQCTN
jgi:hypothetical protein